MIGVAILVTFIVLGAFAPWLTPHDPVQQSLIDSYEPPSSEFWLGTDHLGRDILTRILFGTRYTLFVGVFAIALGMAIGIPLGVLSGYYRGAIDMGVSRVADVMFAFPVIVLALALVATLGVALGNVIIAVGISMVPIFIRVVRGTVLSVREEVFVEAAQSVGARDLRILTRHVLANSWAPIIVQASVGIGITILVAAGLGFLRLGVPPPTPEWGSMLGEARDHLASYPHMTTFPGLAIFLVVLAFNLVGDGLRDALDPRLRVMEGQS